MTKKRKWKLLNCLSKAEVAKLNSGGDGYVLTNGNENSFLAGDVIRVGTKRDKAGDIIEMTFEKEIRDGRPDASDPAASPFIKGEWKNKDASGSDTGGITINFGGPDDRKANPDPYSVTVNFGEPGGPFKPWD
jgi:hypothetical protein